MKKAYIPKKTRIVVKKTVSVFLHLFSVLFVVVGTAGVIYYAKGYRFNPTDTTFISTGVLSIISEPRSATIFIDGNETAKTPKSIGSLAVKSYSVDVKKPEYHTWTKTLPIKSELSTPYNVFMFLTEPPLTENITLEGNITNVQPTENHLFITLTKTDENEKQKIEIYSYKFNNGFWNFSSTPVLIYETTFNHENESISFSPSPNSNLGIISKVNDSDKTYYFLDISHSSAKKKAETEELNLTQFDLEKEFTISWANDNQHILIQTESELYSIHQPSHTDDPTLLYKAKDNNERIIWDTDNNGYVYIVHRPTKEIVNEDKNISHYQIIQAKLDHTNIINNDSASMTIVDDLYTTSETNIDSTILENNINLYSSFKNSINCRKFWGTPTKINVQTEKNGIAISTDMALYWYDSTIQKYTLVSYTSPQFLSFSPNQKGFTYLDTSITNPPHTQLSVYTFDKEDADHLTEIGSHIVLNELVSVDLDSIRWLNDSTYISFIKTTSPTDQTEQQTPTDTLHLIDIDGDNLIPIISQNNIENYAINSKSDSLFLVTESENTTTNNENSTNNIIDNSSIQKYTIH